MPDLTAFLLARISEDETMAHEFDWAKSEDYYTDGLEASPEYVTLYVSPARVLAECEAKKAMITLAEKLSEYEATTLGSPPPRDEFGPRFRQGDLLLLPFARVYSDHPEFDPSWRVERPPEEDVSA